MVLNQDQGLLHFFYNGEQLPGYFFNMPKDVTYSFIVSCTQGCIQLHSPGYDVQDMWGMGYDGAAPMSEEGSECTHLALEEEGFADPAIVHPGCPNVTPSASNL